MESADYFVTERKKASVKPEELLETVYGSKKMADYLFEGFQELAKFDSVKNFLS